MEIISRKDAQLNGLSQYFTGKPCTHGHITYRYTSSGTCAQCVSDSSGRSKQTNVRSRSALDADAVAVAREVAATRERRVAALHRVVTVNVPIARHEDLLLILETAAVVSIAREPVLTPIDLAAGQKANKDAPLYKVKVVDADQRLIIEMADALWSQHSKPVRPVHLERLAALQRKLDEKPTPEWVNRP